MDCSLSMPLYLLGIVDYMSEQAGPPSKPVQAVKQVQELMKDGDDAVILGVFSSEQDAAYEIYMEACKHNSESESLKPVVFNLFRIKDPQIDTY